VRSNTRQDPGPPRDRSTRMVATRAVEQGEPRGYRQLFDRESLADYLRLSTDTIDRLVKASKLPCVRIGSQVRFTADDVEAFLAQNRSPGGTT
jgi:excisionase family DNA binding protein